MVKTLSKRLARWSLAALALVLQLPANAQIQGSIETGQIDHFFYISTQFAQAPLTLNPSDSSPLIGAVSLKIAVVHGGSVPTSLVWSLGQTQLVYEGTPNDIGLPNGWVFGHSGGRGRANLITSSIDTDANDAWDVYLATFNVPDIIIHPGEFLAIGGAEVSNTGTRAFASTTAYTTLSFNGSSLNYSSIQAYPVEFNFRVSSPVPELASFWMLAVGLCGVAGAAACRPPARKNAPAA